MIFKASIALSFALCVLSDRRPVVSEQKVKLHFTDQHDDLSHVDHKEPENHEAYAWTYPSYEFSYQVDDPHKHDEKAQHEVRDGGDVSGNYWLIQPDGEKRFIKYHVDDKSGFTAVINYTSPHSSVYYNLMKHREEAGDSETEMKKEKAKENLQVAHGEGGEKKQEHSKKEGNKDQEKKGGKEERGLKDHQEGRFKGHAQNLEKRGGKESRRYDDNWNWNKGRDGHHTGEGGRDYRQDISKNVGGRNSGRHEKGRDDSREGEGGGYAGHNDGLDKGQKEHYSHKGPRTDKKVDNKHIGCQQGDKQKDKKDDHQNLWVVLPSWDKVQDHPKRHEKPVWEWDGGHSWPGTDAWNRRQGERQKEHRDDNEKQSREEKEGGEDRRGGNQHREGDEEKGSEERRRSDEQRRGGEERRSRGDRRGGEDRRSGGERQRGDEQRRGVDTRRGGEERREHQRRVGENRGQTDHRSQHVVSYTPIPYAQRY